MPRSVGTVPPFVMGARRNRAGYAKGARDPIIKNLNGGGSGSATPGKHARDRIVRRKKAPNRREDAVSRL
jgi:hypothetical protein